VSAPFAFLVHPRTRLAQDLARAWRPLGRIPEPWVDAAVRRLPLPPYAMARVHLDAPTSAGSGRSPVGHIVLVPFGARHMLAEPGEARRRVEQAVDRAAALGAGVVGLGALTATVTAGGVALRGRTDVGVTNGNAFTAAIVDDQVRGVLDGLDGWRTRRVAVVGATGSVGTTLVRLLARDRVVDELTLVARARPRLEALAAGTGVPTRVATDLRAVRDADVVVLLTAAADALLAPEHLGEGAVVVDATQPRNSDPSLLVARPDVTVVDGGVVAVPGLHLRGGDIGLPAGRAYACLAETALLGLSGHAGHFSIGVPTLEQVDHVRALARARVGFEPAPPTSFGSPLVTAGVPAVSGAVR